LTGLWRGAGRPNEVFFLFEVRNMGRAKAFISSPGAVAAAADSGVIDGDYRLIREAGLAARRVIPRLPPGLRG